jgi:cytidylate kinase
MYRAATLVALRDGWIEAGDDEKASYLLRYHMEFIKNPITGYDEMWIDGKNVESAIRDTSLGLSMTIWLQMGEIWALLCSLTLVGNSS